MDLYLCNWLCSCGQPASQPSIMYGKILMLSITWKLSDNMFSYLLYL